MQPFFDSSRGAFDGMFQGTFPDNSDAPAELGKHLYVTRVPADICLKFFYPEIAVGLGRRCIPAPFMPVLEAAVNEDHSPVFWEHEVGRPGKGLYMESITEAFGKKMGTERPLGPRILFSDARHHKAALRRRWNSHASTSCQTMAYEGKRLSGLRDMHRFKCCAQDSIMTATRAGVQR